jgi:hypothetical protein
LLGSLRLLRHGGQRREGDERADADCDKRVCHCILPNGYVDLLPFGTWRPCANTHRLSMSVVANYGDTLLNPHNPMPAVANSSDPRRAKEDE